MGNLCIPGANDTAIHILRADGTTNIYPIKHCNSFADLPGIVQANIVTGVKAEIKQRYQNGERTHIHCFPPHLSDAFIYEGYFHDVILTRLDDMGADLTAYCNTLFGPNLPYILLDGCHIYFVKNGGGHIEVNVVDAMDAMDAAVDTNANAA